MSRPKGSKNKPKFAIEQAIVPNVEPKRRGRPPKWAQPEPKEERAPKRQRQVGQLDIKQAAIEWAPIELTAEQKKRDKEQRESNQDWKLMCHCTHSKTLHKTAGEGKCIKCECKEFE